MRSFRHILERKGEIQQDLARQERNVWGPISNGHVTESWMDLDEAFVETLGRMAQSMFESDFYGNQMLEGIAYDIRHDVQDSSRLNQAPQWEDGGG